MPMLSHAGTPVLARKNLHASMCMCASTHACILMCASTQCTHRKTACNAIVHKQCGVRLHARASRAGQ
eukprot:289803-Chlamydomonas_euryale.AAC.3